jgi:hypothetical protein
MAMNETEARREKKSGKAMQSERTNCEFIIKKKSATVYTGRRGRGQGRCWKPENSKACASVGAGEEGRASGTTTAENMGEWLEADASNRYEEQRKEKGEIRKREKRIIGGRGTKRGKEPRGLHPAHGEGPFEEKKGRESKNCSDNGQKGNE